jgi:YggT family protein
VGILCLLGNAFILTVLVRIVMSWFPLDPDGVAAKVFRVTISITEPVLGPIRRALPPVRMGGMALDLSPILVLLGGQILLGLIGC